MKKRIDLLGNKVVTFSALALVIFGSLMIASAEMGNSVGDTNYLTNVIIKQVIYAVVGILAYFIVMHLRMYKRRINLYYVGYAIILILLLACRFFGQTNGAYAWIRIGNFASIQPSEFAKVFMIVFGARLMGNDSGENNTKNIKTFAITSAIYAGVIAIYQHDFGSAVVLVAICYCIMLIPPYKEYRKIQRGMIIGIFVVIGLIIILMSDPVTNLMKKSDNYMLGRFVAAANPFLYRYDNGYHVIMSLVSFANGNIIGLGYGNSIHKYMNFPNPSNDFILPVIVEELGLVGFLSFVFVYGLLLFPLIRCSFKTQQVSSKIVLLGVSTYFLVHFILNVGGVSAIIPLTGVPLLLISSGGSSLVASLIGLGFAQSELIRNKNLNKE